MDRQQDLQPADTVEVVEGMDSDHSLYGQD